MDPYEELLRYIFGEYIWGQGVQPYEGQVKSIILKEGRTVSLRETLGDILDTLPLTKGMKEAESWPRHIRVLELRFGLRDGKRHSLTETSRELGVSGEWVRKLQEQARSMMRHSERLRPLIAFLGV